MPGQDESALVAQSGAGDHVVPHPLDLQPGKARELGVDVVGQGGLAMAHRGDLDELGAPGQKVGHVPTPWSRRISFSWAVSWRRPSCRRRTTSTQGAKNSPPGYWRRR